MTNDRIRPSHGFLLAALALVFTIGLTFASVELPRLADSFLGEKFKFLDVATIPTDHPDYNPDDIRNLKTELYFKTYHLRWIGYGCLATIFLLILAGFLMNKTGLSSAGALL
jgi:4-hydroxybenzoate polyprenyltransferase